MIYKLNGIIKKLRLSLGINQVVFANKLGVTKQCVSNWENDNVLPSIEMLEKIADLFGVSTDYLLGRTNDNVIDVSGLTDSQRGHIAILVNDFKELNNVISTNNNE